MLVNFLGQESKKGLSGFQVKSYNWPRDKNSGTADDDFDHDNGFKKSKFLVLLKTSLDENNQTHNKHDDYRNDEL